MSRTPARHQRLKSNRRPEESRFVEARQAQASAFHPRRTSLLEIASVGKGLTF